MFDLVHSNFRFEQWEYANDDFARGNPELTFEIQKRYKESLVPKDFEFSLPVPEPGALERRRAHTKAMMEQRRASANDLSNLNL